MTKCMEPVIDRAAWLERRRQTLGASDAAAALGLSPYCSPLQLYLRKIGSLPEQEETEAMRWGTLLEPLLAREYTRRTGNEVLSQQIHTTHSDYPYLSATLDGITAAGHPLEIKTIGAWNSKALGEEETDEIPEQWLVQAHVQMLLAEAERVDFAVLIGGQSFRLFHAPRNDRLIATIVPRLADFMGRIERRDPPPPDHRADAALLHILYPEAEGEIELNEDDRSLLDEYLDHGVAMECVKRVRESCRTRLLQRLGSHALGRLPDGRTIRRKVIHVPEKTFVRKAYSYTGLWIGGAKGEES
jgi:putative phage-type endonuclease